MANWQIEDAPYQYWIKSVELPWIHALAPPDCDVAENEAWPLISIIMPTYNTPPEFLINALESVLNQSYAKWELCITDDASTDPRVVEVIERYVEQDSRIQLALQKHNGGIANASNIALSLAKGRYIAFMDHDDVLPSHALYMMAKEIFAHPTVELLYSDSDNINQSGERCNPYFKPDWDYDLFLGQNYLTHLCVYSNRLLISLNGLREGFDGSQDYELTLRTIENIESNQIRHLPHILYHWRVHATSVSQSNLKQAIHAARKAISEHLDRCAHSASVGSAKNAIIHNRIKWGAAEPLDRLLLIVYGDKKELIRGTAAFIRKITDYDQLVIHELNTAQSIDHVSLGMLFNTYLEKFHEDLICVIPAGFFPESGQWAQRIAGFLNRGSVGAVGAKLITSDGRIIAGPMVMEAGHTPECTPFKQALKGAIESDKGYFASLALDHQVSVLHGAFMATRYQTFERMGGFNPMLSDKILLGADFSFKLHDEGLATVWSANTVMRSHDRAAESALQRQPKEDEFGYFLRHWPAQIKADSFYNPNFSSSGISHHLPEHVPR